MTREIDGLTLRTLANMLVERKCSEACPYEALKRRLRPALEELAAELNPETGEETGKGQEKGVHHDVHVRHVIDVPSLEELAAAMRRSGIAELETDKDSAPSKYAPAPPLEGKSR
jgi:hypothetical protein